VTVRGRTVYRTVGVDTSKEESDLKALDYLLHDTLAIRPAGLGHVKLPFGFFANVIEVGNLGVAISTESVGYARIFLIPVEQWRRLVD
jgi:hypothetical protein